MRLFRGLLLLLFFAFPAVFSETTVFDSDAKYKNFCAAKDEDFPEFYENVITPLMDSVQKTGTIKTKKGTRLQYYFYPAENPRGTVVVFHGFSEYGRKFLETAYYFRQEGFNVCLFDHRGHGYSTRDIPEDLSKVYISDFDIYVSDAKDLLEQIVIPESKDLPLVLFAHSMGGCIGVRFLETYPEYFDTAVLNAPMLEIELGNYPGFIASAIANGAVLFGMEEKYVPGHTAYNPEEEFKPEDEYLYSKTRNYEIYKQRKQDVMYQTNGATYKWLSESMKATKEALKKQKANMSELKEYRLSPVIDVGDFETKLRNASKYLVKGDRIKLSVRFKGRQMAHTELGKEVLEQFAARVTDIADIEQHPKLDGRTMTMLLVPKKNK